MINYFYTRVLSRDRLRFVIFAALISLGACGGGGSDTKDNAVNTAPEISGIPSTSIIVGSTYAFTPTAHDADGDSLTFSVNNAPSWTSFNTGTGTLTAQPQTGDEGSYPDITISVSDGQASASLTAFTFNVTDGVSGNNPPVISGSPRTQVEAGSNYSFIPSASDADGDSLTFLIFRKPSWANFNSANGQLSGTPQASDVDSYEDIILGVSDGTDTTSMPAFSITVTAAAGGNQAPTISGTPASSVTVGQSYSFTPSANDADGDSLSFSIANQPSWSNFNSATGTLSGTPEQSDIDNYTNILISVTDGIETATLPSFEIQVLAAGVGTGSATLNWVAPTKNADGSDLIDLAGYKIFYGPSTGNYTNQIQLNDPDANTYTLDDLSAGTWYFAVKAVSATGSESAYTDEVSKTVTGN